MVLEFGDWPAPTMVLSYLIFASVLKTFFELVCAFWSRRETNSSGREGGVKSKSIIKIKKAEPHRASEAKQGHRDPCQIKKNKTDILTSCQRS